MPNNNVSYTINFAVNTRVRDFFEVDLVTGKVRVRYTSPDDVLDRDGDEPTHRIFFSIFDNFMSEGGALPGAQPSQSEHSLKFHSANIIC